MRIRLSDDLKGGLALALAAVAGMVAMNVGGLRPLYLALLHTEIGVTVGEAALSKHLLHWINDGLMVLFFLVVAMEIKREVVAGTLSRWRRAALPVYGALGGMVVPALVFVGIVGIDSAEARGWAIPCATDIAFAVGVLSVFGARVPPALRSFLLTLAVADDLGAIAIIALFYTDSLALAPLAGAGGLLALLVAMNLGGVRRLGAYVLVGVALWLCVLHSGVHATLAGVALGFAVPLAADARGHSPLATLEHALQPLVTFGIMPLFAFANAGVPLAGLTWARLGDPLVLAIGLGLFLGKQIGVYGACLLALRLRLAEAPPGATPAQLYAVALLAGIGFTMSLFIGSLAFADAGHQDALRVGVILGSLASALVGSAVLLRVTTRVRPHGPARAAGGPAGA